MARLDLNDKIGVDGDGALGGDAAALVGVFAPLLLPELLLLPTDNRGPALTLTSGGFICDPCRFNKLNIDVCGDGAVPPLPPAALVSLPSLLL
jgi:hypothetical protein